MASRFGKLFHDADQTTLVLGLLPGHTVGMDELGKRLIRAWALNNVAHAAALPQTGLASLSQTHQVADGYLVISGSGMYVNRAMAVGIYQEISSADIDSIVSISHSAGVEPSFEVTPFTLPSTVELLRRYGFVHDPLRDTTASARQIPGPEIAAPDDIVVRPIISETDLAFWQEVSAAGWEHTSLERRAASDLFSAAAYVNDRDGMVVAFDAENDYPVGCASVTIRDGIATLGGMSTVTAHRRRGVQAALIRHRLQFASKNGCDMAASTAATNGDSQRNLSRHGFAALFEIETWTSA